MFIFFFQRGIARIGNKKVCKVKNVQVWVPQDNFEQKGKKHGKPKELRKVVIAGVCIYFIETNSKLCKIGHKIKNTQLQSKPSK